MALDRLSALDASFLHQEGPDAHMHIGGIAIFAGAPPTLEELLARTRSRLAHAPRYRQRLEHTPLDRGRPAWVDDPSFRVEYHLHHVALPAPGDRATLLELVERIFSTQLDRSRPLWELWLVEGAPDGTFACVFKTHHALVDGIGGIGLTTLLMDGDGAQDDVETEAEREPSTPLSGPSLMLAELAATLRGGVALAGRALAAAADPAATLAAARNVVAGLGEVTRAVASPAPRSPLNRPIGPHRRLAFVTRPLADVAAAGRPFGATVNDVVLAAVAGALRRLLLSRGASVSGPPLRALVPVSVRDGGASGELGNRLAAVRAPLPVGIADPLARLAAVTGEMNRVKRSGQASASGLIAALQNYAPPGMLAWSSRIQFSTWLFNLLVTNVPGPRETQRLFGCELVELQPVAFLARDHALAVAALSYHGELSFGLIADAEALPELHTLGEWIGEELDTLIRLTRRPGQPASAS